MPSLTQLYNPSVSRLRETREPAPFTQGSLWVLPHQCVYRYFSEESEKCTTFFYELSKIIIPHSLVRNDAVSFRPFLTTQPTAIRSIPNCFRRCGRGILKGAAVRQRPLSPLTSQGSFRDKNLAPEGTAPKASRRLENRHTLAIYGPMRASAPTDSYEGFLNF